MLPSSLQQVATLATLPDVQAAISSMGRQSNFPGSIKVAMMPRAISSTYVFDFAVNNFTMGQHVDSTGITALNTTDFGLIVYDNVSATTTFGHTADVMIAYPTYTQFPNGDIVAPAIGGSAYQLTAGAITVNVSAQFTKMSNRVIRKRVYFSTVSGSGLIAYFDGIAIAYSGTARVYGNEKNVVIRGTYQNEYIFGYALDMYGTNPSVAGLGNLAYGVGFGDGFQNGRKLGSAASVNNYNNVSSLAIGNNAGAPLFPISTTPNYIEMFYWATDFKNDPTGYDRQHQINMCYCEFLGMPANMDDMTRMFAVGFFSCKSVDTIGGTLPDLQWSAGGGFDYERDSFWGCMAAQDMVFSNALLARWVGTLATQNGYLDCVADNVVPGFTSPVYRTAGDGCAIALLWAYYNEARTIQNGLAALTCGMTAGQRNSMVIGLCQFDDGTGRLVYSYTNATNSGTFGHYDWVHALPARFGVNTTHAASTVAGAGTIFTPVAMTGIVNGMQLVIDAGLAQEVITLTAVGGSTFTATTTKAHTGSFIVQSGLESSQMDGYYACALIAAEALGFTTANMGTTTGNTLLAGLSTAQVIQNAITAYQNSFNNTDGHLNFYKSLDAPSGAGTWYDYASLIDLLPEWHAVFVLGMHYGLLGGTRVAAAVNYFMTNHMINFSGVTFPQISTTTSTSIGTSGNNIVITPASITGIVPGIEVVLDSGNAALAEVCYVQSVTGSTFTIGYCVNTHTSVPYTITGYATRQGGRGLKVLMLNGGQTYPTQSEIGNFPNGLYTNGGSQIPFDFVLASLGQHYKSLGFPVNFDMRQFWSDRKYAEVNHDFFAHEALTGVYPSPGIISGQEDPYNGRNSFNMVWHGIIAAYEKSSGLVD